nr:hypothetical protein [uncultured Acetatifactor sp.]
MINTIMEAISVALDAEFGDGYETYIEEISQDMDGHAFFIQCPNPTDRLFLGKRYFRQNQFCIQYFPLSEDDRNRECYEVLERMNLCLEYIDVDGPMMGTKMNGKVVDGVLSFFVNYDCFVYRRGEAVPMMEEVSSETHVKG